MSKMRTPAEIRAWFDVHGGTEAGRLAAVRAVRGILAMHDEVTVMVFDDAQPVCREDGQEYDGIDLPGCRTTRAINAEINHVQAGDAIVTGSGVSSQDTPPAPRTARDEKLARLRAEMAAAGLDAPQPHPRHWPTSSDEPDEPGLVVTTPGGARFRHDCDPAARRWVALLPEGTGALYTWRELNGGWRPVPLTEVLPEVVVPTDTDGTPLDPRTWKPGATS